MNLFMNKIPHYKIAKEFLFENNDHAIVGSSMNPMLKNGQKIEIAPVNCPLVIGHVYIFSLEGKLIMHRLIDIHGETAIFMGDFSFAIEKVPVNQVIGALRCQYHAFSLLLINAINRVCYKACRLKRLHGIVQSFRITVINTFSGVFENERKICKT